MKKKIIFLMIASIILTSCGGVTPVPTVTSTLAVTALPTNTKLPEPSVTNTPSQSEKIFTQSTPEFRLIDTPTPIATPDIDSSSMGLKIITESDFLDFIDRLNHYSFQNFSPLGDWWTDGHFIASQEPVGTAIQEFLYRFPNSSESERLKWQLAFINTLQFSGLPGNHYGDSWMLADLENRLNEGEAPPDHIENILEHYWFDVVYSHPVENLFHDAKTSWIYQISPRVWAQQYPYEIQHDVSQSVGSLFFVVRDDGHGKFKIYLLYSAWNYSFGESSIFSLEDHNKNGFPEIALYIGSHSGTMCGGNLLIYEWQSDSFSELTNNIISLGDCGESFEYSQSNEIPAIIQSTSFPAHKERYLWNGNAYIFDQYIDITPFELWRNSLGYSSWSYPAETEMLNGILASGTAENYGLGYPDYLRYRLGVDYAFQSMPDEAVKVFQDLVSSPLDKSRNLFPDMAKAFMDAYTGNASIYNACNQSLKVFNNALDPYRDSNGDVDTEKRQSIFGFSFTSFNLYVFPLCDESNAFSLTVNSVPSETNNLPAVLQKNGVDLNFSQKIDVNLDGKAEEWIVVFDTNNLFLIYPYGSRYQVRSIDASVEVDKTNASSFQVAIEKWSNFPDPVMIIQSKQDFTLLSVSKNFEVKHLFDEFGVSNYVISNQDITPQFQLFYEKPRSPDFPYYPWSGYRWDLSENTFKNDLLEYDLFVLGEPEKSVEIVDTVFPLFKKWKDTSNASTWSLPYLYYISGLSYELSGNRQKAAQIYWQLWHDFPESSYALLARYKLELVKP